MSDDRRHRALLPAWASGVAVVLVTGCLSVGAPAVAAGPTSTEARLRQAEAFALRQVARTEHGQPPGRYPFVAVDDQPWRTTDAGNWMAGFFPGQLWLAYEATGDRSWARLAKERQQQLAGRANDTSTHDVGFVMYDSFGQQQRLTRDSGARAVLLRAADSLATRWVPQAHTLRSWDGPPGQVTVIVDNMVNLELLFWAARHGGPARLRDIALAHALTTRDQLVRADGSTFHAVRFDEATGERVWRGNIGGRRDRSTWARGQAWAVYGFTMAYRVTRDRRLLEVARRTARFALRNLPRDGVPYWDYAVPVTRSTPRDSSAGAVLASALLELARIDPDHERRARYRAAGLHTLHTLAGPRYLARGTGGRSVLLHARNNPAYPDVGVPYGDYYFLEALQRRQLLPAGRRALPVAKVSADRALPGHSARDVLDQRSSTRWVAGGDRPQLTVQLPTLHRVDGVSVAWWHGTASTTRLRISTSRDGLHWSTARALVSSGRSSRLETYDIRPHVARYVRLTCLDSTNHRCAVSTVRLR